MATLKDVARLAGVSPATASLAINGKPVRELTRKRVLECARELRYVPVQSGRTLSTGKSNIVQLLIINSRRHTDLFRETFYFNHIVQGIIRVLQSHDYGLFFDVQTWENGSLPEYFQRKIMDRSTDGMIIMPQFHCPYEFLDLLQRHGFPCLFLNPHCARDQVNFISVDNEMGGRLVADHLAAPGVERVAYIGGPEHHFDTMERERGFTAELAARGITVPAHARYYGDYTVASGYLGMRRILARCRPQALFCFNDYMAAGAIRCLHEAGIRVPGEISVAGYDNIEISTAVYPLLTTVDYQVQQLGERMARGIWRIMNKRGSTVRMRIEPRLVGRSSTRPVRQGCEPPGWNTTREKQPGKTS